VQLHHWIVLTIIALAAYYVGANYKLGLPLLG
jgi:hypothetical protein